jgi:D-alanyl-D-alanine carboxypeptidase
MTRDDVLDFSAGLPAAVEDYPFGDGVAVFKVCDRMFALVSLEGDQGFVNLKCEPELAPELRARHASVRPGYDANKRHWNSVDREHVFAERAGFRHKLAPDPFALFRTCARSADMALTEAGCGACSYDLSLVGHTETSPGDGRSRMRRLWTVVATVALVVSVAVPSAVAGTASSSSQQLSGEKLRAVDSIAWSGFLASGAPGMSVGIWARDKAQYVRTFGVDNINPPSNMSTDDHVRIASNTKTFVATAILQLVDRGQLGLDDHLDTFIKGVTYGDQVTIRQLLNMTAGVFDYTDDPQFVQAYIADPLLPFSLQDVLTIINANSPRYPPGGPAAYDDSNYYLLGAIVEAVTHRTLGDVIQTEILDPLGLNETSYPTTADMPTPFAHGYYPVSDAAPRDVTLSNPAVPAGAGAMISTLGDMKLWAKALATGALLSPATQSLRLQTNVLSVNPSVTTSYGLGIGDVNGFLGHTGGILGYSTALFYLPHQQATIVVILNGATLSNEPAATTFLALAAYLYPKQFPNGL